MYSLLAVVLFRRNRPGTLARLDCGTKEARISQRVASRFATRTVKEIRRDRIVVISQVVVDPVHNLFECH